MQHAWRGLFISLRWESNLTAADRVSSSSTSADHVLRRGRRGALIDPQTSLLGIGTNLSRASGWSRVGTRPTSTASCQQKQTTTMMTNFVSPAPWLLRDRFSASGEPHVMAATKMFWIFPPSDQILAFHQRLPPTSPHWTTLTSFEYRYSHCLSTCTCLQAAMFKESRPLVMLAELTDALHA
jgi:hypothetical protein